MSGWMLFATLVVSLGAEAPAQAGRQLVPQSVVEVIINNSRLAKFFHPEVSDRVPLVLSDNLLATGLILTKFGQPVQIIPDREIGARPHLRFVRYELKGSEANVEIEYEVEGVHATFTLVKMSGSSWKVKGLKLVEY